MSDADSERAKDEEEEGFLDAIVSETRSIAPRLVYADFLLARNDPRGELITVQHARDDRPFDLALERRECELIEQLDGQILGVGAGSSSAALAFEWRHGFVETVTVRREVSSIDLDACLRHPMFRFVRTVRSANPGRSSSTKVVMRTLLDAGATSVRRLELGSANSSMVVSSEFDALAPYCGSLAELVVFSPYAFPEQRVFGAFNDLPLTSVAVLEVAQHALLETFEARWPLETLVVQLNERNTSLDDLEPLLNGAVFPKLRRFELVNASFTNAFLARLATSPMLRRLETLGISTLTIGVHALRVLETDAFAHVRVIPPSTESATMGVFADKLRTKLARPAHAVPLYEARLRQSPVDVSAAIGLGQALSDLARHEDAIAAFDVAIQNAGRDASNVGQAWHGRHLALVALGRLDDAITSLERALEIDFRSVEWWRVLAELFDRAGLTERASSARQKGFEASRSPF